MNLATESPAPPSPSRMPLHQAAQLARSQVLAPHWRRSADGPSVAAVISIVSAYRRSKVSASDFIAAVARPEVTEATLFCWDRGCRAPKGGGSDGGQEWPELQLALLRLHVAAPLPADPPPAAPAAAAPEAVVPKPQVPPPVSLVDLAIAPPALASDPRLPPDAVGYVVEWLGGTVKPRDLPGKRGEAIAAHLRQFATPGDFVRAVRLAQPALFAVGAGRATLVVGNKAKAIVQRFSEGPRSADFDPGAWGLQPAPRRKSFGGEPAPIRQPEASAAEPRRRPSAPAMPAREESAAGPRDDGAIELRLVVRPGDPLYPTAAALIRRRQA